MIAEAATAAGDEDPLLVPLTASSEAVEREVLDRILASGIDQGAFVRPPQHQLAVVADERLARLLRDVSARASCSPGVEDPFFDRDPPQGPIDGDEPGWVVLTQRCDLIRAYRIEPLVELARAEPVTDRDILDQARSNSPRYIVLAERPDGAWVIDLRRRAWLPKHLLPDQDAVQPLATARARKRLRLRLGQRYWRDPVPDDIVRDVQRPLREALRRSRTRVRLGGYFSDWLGVRDGDKVLVLAIVGALAKVKTAARPRQPSTSSWTSSSRTSGNGWRPNPPSSTSTTSAWASGSRPSSSTSTTSPTVALSASYASC